jgi:hypothetical protein
MSDADTESQLKVEKHPEKCVGKYRWKHRAPRVRLHRHMHHSLCGELNLDLNPDLDSALHRTLLR